MSANVFPLETDAKFLLERHKWFVSALKEHAPSYVYDAFRGDDHNAYREALDRAGIRAMTEHYPSDRKIVVKLFFGDNGPVSEFRYDQEPA